MDDLEDPLRPDDGLPIQEFNEAELEAMEALLDQPDDTVVPNQGSVSPSITSEADAETISLVNDEENFNEPYGLRKRPADSTKNINTRRSKSARLENIVVQRNEHPSDDDKSRSYIEDDVDETQNEPDGAEDADDEEESGEDDDEEQDEQDDAEPADTHRAALQHQGDRQIHVGDEYQAAVEEPQKGLDLDDTIMSDDEDRDDVLWRPNANCSPEKIEAFLKKMMEKYELNEERCLFLLHNCKYNMDLVAECIEKKTIIDEEWTDDDRVLFKNAYAVYGKNFAKIRQTMPHKTVGSVVNHYYAAKKQYELKSHFDQTDATGNTDDDSSEDELEYQEGACENCGHKVSRLHLVNDVQMCFACKMYLKLMQKTRPCSYVATIETRPKKTHKGLEENSVINAELIDIAKEFIDNSMKVPVDTTTNGDGPSTGPRATRKRNKICHSEIKTLESEIAAARQRCYRIEAKHREERTKLLATPFPKYKGWTLKEEKKEEESNRRVRHAYTWTDNEKSSAFFCIQRYGTDFETVAELIGTKSADMVKGFYTDQKEFFDKYMDSKTVELKSNADKLREKDIEEEIKLNEPEVVELE